MTEHKNVTEALAAVMGALPAIGKDGKADPAQGGYSYRGIEDITSKAQTLLAEHQVVPYPRVVGAPVITQIEVRGKPWTDTMLRVEYRFKHGPSDTEEVAGPFVGIGRDNSDKGANKAMTQTFKYALIQVLCIGDKKDDSDGQSHEGDETQSGPPWFEQAGYMDTAHAKDTNDALRVLVEEALKRPREAREPMKAWLAEHGYSTWLPVTLADSTDWEATLRAVLVDFPAVERAPVAGQSEGEPESGDGGAGAPPDEPAAENQQPAVTDEAVEAAKERARQTTQKAQGATKKAASRAPGAKKAAPPKEPLSTHLDNGELRITPSHLQEVHVLFTKLDGNLSRDRKLQYTRDALAAQGLQSSTEMSDAQAVELIDHLRIAVGDAPPPTEEAPF